MIKQCNLHKFVILSPFMVLTRFHLPKKKMKPGFHLNKNKPIQNESCNKFIRFYAMTPNFARQMADKTNSFIN